jgi:hypothetical protein
MDDPLVPKRLDQAITMVGTCMDMCPRFERYRRERENNLTDWEVVRLISCGCSCFFNPHSRYLEQNALIIAKLLRCTNAPLAIKHFLLIYDHLMSSKCASSASYDLHQY